MPLYCGATSTALCRRRSVFTASLDETAEGVDARPSSDMTTIRRGTSLSVVLGATTGGSTRRVQFE